VFTIGTGCCESTAPFLYEDFWPGPDAEAVGEVAGVEVFAPEYLRSLYPGNDGVVIDVDDGLMAESMSIETETLPVRAARRRARRLRAAERARLRRARRGLGPAHARATRAPGSAAPRAHALAGTGSRPMEMP
jgi:hypothetical protein